MTRRLPAVSRRATALAATALAIAAAALGGFAAWQRETIVLAAEGYVFGYPLVVMDVTRANAAQVIGPENALRRVRAFPDARFRDVVRPNVDTLYTTAFIDTARGPWVFEMAPNALRYEVMPFLDAWTDVIATPGTRTSGASGARLLIAAPGWRGDVPAGLELVRAPTRIVWLIGRTQTNGAADFPLVHRLQDGVTLRPLAAWRAGRDEPAPDWRAAQPAPAPPVEQMRAMDVDAFFSRLARLMTDNPPRAADAPMLARLARLGVAPGRPPRWSAAERWAAALGRRVADWRIARELARPRNVVNGWSTPPAILGRYGTQYDVRAVVAMVGLGANLPEDATYPNTRVDAAGEPLNGSRRYRLRFAAGALPPVDAFWSVTAYGPDDFLIDNPLNRYALGDRDPLVAGADGSIELLVQADPPPPERRANWLPVKAGQDFVLNARLYRPRAQALDGRWSMPPVERLE